MSSFEKAQMIVDDDDAFHKLKQDLRQSKFVTKLGISSVLNECLTRRASISSTCSDCTSTATTPVKDVDVITTCSSSIMSTRNSWVMKETISTARKHTRRRSYGSSPGSSFISDFVAIARPRSFVKSQSNSSPQDIEKNLRDPTNLRRNSTFGRLEGNDRRNMFEKLKEKVSINRTASEDDEDSARMLERRRRLSLPRRIKCPRTGYTYYSDMM